MPEIRILPDNVANQIAAGEVVERPMSVVKELLENAIDAGATRISIGFRNGGKSFMSVEDNGCGMTRDQALLALERHATSKIRAASDLDEIRSFGFRGEALPSIASVSSFLLRTRTRDAELGTEILVEGGKYRACRENGMPAGTRIEISRLFFNVPARLKFLKSENTEAAHITRCVRLYAVAHPEIAFTLWENDREIFRSPAGTDLRERVGAIWGRQLADDLRPLDAAESAGMRVSGLIGKPGVSRASRAEMVTVVNGRPVDNRTMAYSLVESFHTLIPRGRYPLAFLFLEIDPHAVDVNVHPAKHEVRFHQSRLVHDFIYQGVLSVLQQQLETPLPLDDEPQPAPRSIPENRVAAGRNHFAEPAAREPVAPRYTPAPASGSRPAAPWPNAQPGYQKQQGEVYRQLLQTPAPMQKPKAPEPQEPALAANSQSFGRVLTIVHSDCALLERDGNISLLSLPVAERWLRQAQLTPGEAPVCAQPLLIPLRLKVSAEEKSALEKAQSALAELGIDFQSDAQHVTIRAVPLPLRQQNLQILIPELIGYLAKQSVFEPGNIAQWIARNLMSEHAQWSMAQAITLLADVERLCPQLVKTPPGGLLQSVDLHPAIKALKDE